MPTDKIEVGNLCIIDPNTGQRTEINGIASINVTTERIEETEPIIDLTEPKELTGTFEIKDMKILRELLYKSFTISGTIEEIAREVFLNMPLGCEVADLEFKQNRTHKRKRINKKWQKRYGYTCKVYYVEGEQYARYKD